MKKSETKKETKKQIKKPEEKKDWNFVEKIKKKAEAVNTEASVKLNKKMKGFCVIGLGRFGRTVALSLANEGHDVLAIDKYEKNVHAIEKYVAGTAIADSTAPDVLHNLGVQNFDCVVICIGQDLEASIVTTLICKRLGVDLIVARASTDEQEEILEKIGADVIVFPEDFTAHKVAKMLSNPSMNDVINLTDKFKIVEMATPDDWADKTLMEIDTRRKYHVSIIVIKRQDFIIYPEPETELKKGDVLVVAGEKKTLAELSGKTSEVIDVLHALSSGARFD
nr:TrkA family potassium uptake protein [Clostridia bacterium]